MDDETTEDRIADDLYDDLDGFTRERMTEPTDRGSRARVAANIAEDRYSAGSTAARVALIVYLRHGPSAALDFIEDLDHHEGR